MLFGLGHLPSDRHDFTLPVRRQSRRPDVRLHQRQLNAEESLTHRGLLVTRPARTAADLLTDNEDPEAVGHVIADAIRAGMDEPGRFAQALVPVAERFGLRFGDGISVLRWLLELVGDRDTTSWLEGARSALMVRLARA